MTNDVTDTASTTDGDPVQPMNGLDLLIDQPENATSTIEQALTDSGALDETALDETGPADPVHARAAKHMRKQIAEQIAGILVQLPVTDMLVGGWKHLGKVEEARAETFLDGTTKTISVGNHELTVRHDPQVDLVIDRLPVPLLKLFFDVVFTIDASVFEISAGEITRTTPGPISVKAMLSSNKVTILERATPKVDPRGLWPFLHFDGPFVIVPDPTTAAAEPVKPDPTKSQLSF